MLFLLDRKIPHLNSYLNGTWFTECLKSLCNTTEQCFQSRRVTARVSCGSAHHGKRGHDSSAGLTLLTPTEQGLHLIALRTGYHNPEQAVLVGEDVPDNPAVLSNRLDGTGPHRFVDRRQRDEPWSPSSRHVKFNLMAGHRKVGPMVEDKHSLVTVRKSHSNAFEHFRL